METIEVSTENEQPTKAAIVCKHVREVKVNYRGTRKEWVAILDSKRAADFVRKILPDNSREHFVALYLDARKSLIGYAVVATGSAECCLAHPREVFQRAVLLGAVYLLIAHNHTSGATKPSEADQATTENMREAGDLLGIKLIDRVILSDASHFSSAESGSL